MVARTRFFLLRRCRSGGSICTGGASLGATLGTQLLEELLALFRRHLGNLLALLWREIAHGAARLAGCVLHGLIDLLDLFRIDHVDLRAFAQTVDTVGHHLVAGLQIATHTDIVAIGHAHGDLALRHRVVGLDQIDIVVLHRVRWHDQGLVNLPHLQLHIDELIGKQMAVGIVESGLGLDGARRRVDGVVQRIELALGQHLLLFTVPQLHRHGLARAQLFGQRADMNLWDGESRVNGPHLGDGHQAVGVRGVDHIAQIRLAQAQAPRDGRRDLGIAQLQLGRIDLTLVCRHRALQLAHQRFLGIDLLACDGILLEQLAVTLQVQLRILELSLIPGQRTLHLGQRSRKAARVDLGQQLACLDLIAFLEMQLEQLARDLGAHHGRGPCAHGADGADEYPHVALLHHSHGYGLGLSHAARASRPHAAATTTASTRRLRSWFCSC